jgi:hypothetical protein
VIPEQSINNDNRSENHDVSKNKTDLVKSCDLNTSEGIECGSDFVDLINGFNFKKRAGKVSKVVTRGNSRKVQMK